MNVTPQIKQYIAHHREEAYNLLLQLAQIPAPSRHEEKSAEFCKKWLLENGAEDVYTDEANNVILEIGCDDEKPVAVFMAHSDVVFPDTDKLALHVENGKVYCPGVGDDTANAVALLTVMKYLANNRFETSKGLLLVINSGEEGLGNLYGTRAVFEKYKDRICEFVTFDGYAETIYSKAVGSRRYLIEIETEGGHSWSNFGNSNAIAQMAQVIEKLYDAKLPEAGKTTFNVGTVNGGTSVNTIAQKANALYEFRSDTAINLDGVQSFYSGVIEHFKSMGYKITSTLLGERPCGAQIKEGMDSLCERAEAAIVNAYGITPVFGAGSTDCNIPLSLGIPAVCLSCVRGGGAHTREEYVEIDSLLPGLQVAFEVILYHCKGEQK